MASLELLPIDEFIPDILEELKTSSCLVLTAAPGAGKTTRLPPALAKISRKKVLVLEPRRMAAIAAAHRIAEEQGWTVGEEIGYQVRFANKVSAKTNLIFMTEALLARQMIVDPELSDVEVVVLDEFHERSVHVDLALGLIKELQELGRDIKLVVMSATLEAEKISAFLGDCKIVSVPGKLFPLEIKNQKSSLLLQTFPQFFDHVFATVKEAHAKTSRDILVFLPGVGEIERAQRTLEDWAVQKNVLLVPLHGTLKIEEQRRALQRSSQQRVILSTNIAESSVTIDGVDTVIDTGLAKVLRQDYKTGFSRLEMTRISLSSAIQRAGRAARQFPGTCYRLWNQFDEAAFEKNEIPEILRTDLTESLLFLSAQGVSDFTSFSWYETPHPLAIKSASQYLQISGAISDKNTLTTLGRELLQFPLPVRLAKLMLIGLELNSAPLASDIAALLQERDVFRKNGSSHYLGDNLEDDLAARLHALEEFRRTKKVGKDGAFMAFQTVDQASQQIFNLTKRLSPPSKTQAPTNPYGELMVRAFSDRLCRRRGKSERAVMVGGRGVKLHKESLVLHSEFFGALNGVDGAGTDTETVVSLAVGFSKDFILETFRTEIQKTQDIVFSEEKGQFFSRQFRSLYGLALDEPTLAPASKDDIREKLPQILCSRFDFALKENEALARWWARREFLLQHSSSISTTAIPVHDTEELKLEAFSQACLGESNINTVLNKDLVFYFENVFPQELVRVLHQEVPDKIKVPSGSLIPVHYPLDKPPYLEVRIQEIFGLLQTPKVLFGKLPVTFHLLGPNFRPVQVTANLESFWSQAYSEVRKELRLKYPKHQWPEDPFEGTPEAKGRRRQ